MARKKISAKEFVEQATGLRLSAHEKLCAERMKNIQDSIKELSKEIINEAVNKSTVSQVGIHFLKFCSKWNLQRMSEQPGDYADFLNGQVR